MQRPLVYMNIIIRNDYFAFELTLQFPKELNDKFKCLCIRLKFFMSKNRPQEAEKIRKFSLPSFLLSFGEWRVHNFTVLTFLYVILKESMCISTATLELLVVSCNSVPFNKQILKCISLVASFQKNKVIT